MSVSPAGPPGAGVVPGSRIGPYTVGEPIGRGAMGVVYSARHDGLGRPVAIKVLQSLAPDPLAAARFRREAQAIARLRHPNILTLHDYGEVGGLPYMVVEHLPNGSLADLMDAGRVDRAATARILSQVAAALDHAHERGIVHRDVKPANVLFADDGTAVLADFGLARLAQSSSRTATGVSVGTPYYMAPEQVTGEEVGPAADRYALATVAYEMVCGGLPFGGDEVMKVLFTKVHEDAPPPSAHDPSITLSLDALLLRGLSRDPAARWPSCGAMVRALEAALTSVAPTMVLARGGAAAVAAAGVASGAAGSGAGVAASGAARSGAGSGVVAVASGAAAGPVVSGARAGAAVVEPDRASTDVERPHTAARRPGRLRWAAAAAVTVLAVAGAWLAIRSHSAAQTVQLPPQVAAPGEPVSYSFDGVPAGRLVRFYVDGSPRASARASASGTVVVTVRVPLVAAPGRHIVTGCWNGTCPVKGYLQVRRAAAYAFSPGSTGSAAG